MNSDLLVVLTGRVIQIVTTVVSLRLLTTQLTPGEMGKYSLITSTTALFALIFITPVGMYINRKLNQWYDEALLWNKLIYGLYYLLAVTIATALLLFLLFQTTNILNIGIRETWLVCLVCFTLFSNTVNQTVIPSLNMLGKRKEWAIYTVISLWVGLAASWHLTSTYPLAEYWQLGQIIGLSCGAVLGCFSLYHIGKSSLSRIKICINKNFLKSIFMFTFPILVAVGFNWVQFQSYRFIVEKIAGLQLLGLFVAGYTISAGIMAAFESTVIQYYYPHFFKEISSTDKREMGYAWNKYAKIVFPLTILTMFYICINAQELTSILISKAYAASYSFVAWGSIAELGRILGNAYSLVAHAKMETKYLIIPQAIGALSAIIMVPTMIFILPTDGIGIALAGSSILYVITMHIAMSRLLTISIDLSKVLHAIYWSLLIAIVWKMTTYFIKFGIINDFFVLGITGLFYLIAVYCILKENIYGALTNNV